MSLDGALFDLAKVANISKERMAYKKASDLKEEVKSWAKTYDVAFYNKIIANEDFFTNILNIEREKEKPRKDYSKYSDIYPIISFFYDDVYAEIDKKSLDFTIQINKTDVKYCSVCDAEDIEQIQRLAGYLVGTTSRWNNAKLSELRDRVTHIGGNDEIKGA